MSLRLRKLFVWLVSLGVVFAIYLLYSQISETPRININTAAELTESESNVAEFDGEVGKIGNVGVGTVRKAKFIHLNENKEIDRESGFEKLLHKEGDEWQLEKPYMNIFRDNFTCSITSDTGNVRVETAAGRPSPKEGKLTGNVVIHILPVNSSNIKESFIYLDDLVFISEKSQFSTEGPVKFVSEEAQMLGRGLELVYNSELDQLEFLRIIHLETLQLKTPLKTSSFSLGRTKADESAAGSAWSETEQPLETAAVGDSEEPKLSQKTSKQVIEQPQDRYYRCLFSKNVIVDCPEQLIYAGELFLNYILWSKGTSQTDAESADDAETQDVNDAGQTEPDEAAQELVDIVITCDNGIFITPMDSAKVYGSSAKFGTEATVTADKGLKGFGAIHGQKKYTLSAPKLTVNLSKDKASATGIEHITASGGVVQLSSVKKAGEEPRFAKSSQNVNPEKILGFTKLKAIQFDYTPDERLFVATGPGVIAVNNSSAPEPNSEAGKFSLQKPCIAAVRNFETFKYYLETNRIIADNSRQRVLIDYFPIVEGQYGRQVTVTAGHIEADFIEIADGRFELSTLSATGGIEYEEENVQFEGGELFFDADKSIITAEGDESQPCLLNGALVDAIEYNLTTGAINAKIIGPGALIKR